jgi:hypothetical protein
MTTTHDGSCGRQKRSHFKAVADDPQRLIMERVQMRYKVHSVVAAVALLASVGLANAKDAKGPVELQDVQLDKVTAGASPTSQTASLVAASTVTLNRLLTISNATVGFLNGVPQSALPLSAFPVTP